MADKSFNIKLLEFDGSDMGTSIIEWNEKPELVRDPCRVKRVNKVISLQLTGGTFAVYTNSYVPRHVLM